MFGRRQLFHYEAPEDGGGDAGGGGWQPTQEWGSRIDGFIESAGPVLGQLQEILNDPGDYGQQDDALAQWQRDYEAWQQQYGGQLGVQGQPQAPQFDPSVIEAAVQQAMSPFMPVMEQFAAQQGEAYANEVLGQLESEIGTFDRDRTITLAQAYLAQGADPQQALRQAASDVHAWETSISEKAVQAFKESLTNAASATGDMGAGGAAVDLPGQPKGPGRYEEVIRRHMAGVDSLS